MPGDLRLFNPEAYPQGSFTPGLPDNVLHNAGTAARHHLFSKPRYSREIGHPDEMHDIEFDPRTNTWVESIGAMGSMVGSFDVALNGARAYMSDVMGVDYFRFTNDLGGVAQQVAEEYDRYYPPAREAVMLEPGY